MREGEWVIVNVGGNYCRIIGYITHVGHWGGCIQIMKIIRIINGKWQWLKPSTGSYSAEKIKSAEDFLEQHQDKSVLIDLALLTRDKQWFNQLTKEGEESLKKV